MQEKLYTVAQLAEMFGKTPQTIHNWIKDKRFPGHFTVGEGGGKMILVPASAVKAVAEEEAERLIQQLDRLGFQTVPA